MSFYTSEKMLITITSLIKDAEEFYEQILLNRDHIKGEIIKDIQQELNIDDEHAKILYELIKNNTT